jgi:hypothetical protein
MPPKNKPNPPWGEGHQRPPPDRDRSGLIGGNSGEEDDTVRLSALSPAPSPAPTSQDSVSLGSANSASATPTSCSRAASPLFEEQGDPKRIKFASFAETFEHKGLNPHAQVDLPLSDAELEEQPGPVALFLNRRFQGKANAEAIGDALDLAGEWASYTCLDSDHATALDKVNVASALCRLMRSVKDAGFLHVV